MKSKINLIWIVVADLKKAIKYYNEVLGLEIFEVHHDFGWAELGQANGCRLGLAQVSPETDIAPGSNAIITLSVDNIETAKSELIGKGATLIGDIMEVPGHVKMQMVSDLDGNKFQLVELL